jgi:ligand-binding SRPBCC domain-containing protein
MVRGAFHSFTHAHLFRRTKDGTLMVDIFRYTSPLGPLGWLADWLFLKRYMTRFLQERAQYLKRAAELSES